MIFIKCFKNSILLSGPNRTSERPSYLFSLGIHNITREYKKLDYKQTFEDEIRKNKISENNNQWVKISPLHFH